MKKWVNNTIWPCKRLGVYPQIYVERAKLEKDNKIKISFFSIRGDIGRSLYLDKRMTRLLARRLTQCLEDK